MKYAPIWCNPKLVLKVTASVGALIIAAGQANAQETTNAANANGADAGHRVQVALNDDDTNKSDIIVTGSNIRGNRDLSTSLTTITRDDFEKSGFLDVGQAIRSLPQNFGGGLSVENNAIGIAQDRANLNTSSATSPNLRALGPGATLTLLNGDRLPTAGVGLATDISLIPAAAIERVEVLADGASAIYGADAVAGVVNIITRRKFDGLEARGLYGGADDGMGTYKGSVLAGTTIGRFDGVLSAEYLRQNSLSAADREASQNLPLPYTVIPLQKRVSVMGSGTFEFSPNLRLVADGLFTSATQDSKAANAYYSSTTHNKNQEYVIDAGLDASVGSSWHASLLGRISENRSDLVSVGLLPDGTGFTTLFGRVTNNKSVQFNADGTLFNIPGGAVKASLGAAYRNEKIRDTDTPSVPVGRDVASIFGEIAVPLFSPEQSIPFIRRFTLTVAGRYDSYSAGLGSAFVPKFAAAWELSDQFELRGSYSKSYRVANLYEQTSAYTAYILNVQDNVPGGTSNILWLQGTGRALRPEKSDNINFQVRYHPTWIKGLDLSLGYYRFLYKDRIADPDPTIVATTDIRNILPAMLTRSPSQRQIGALIDGAGFFAGGDPTTVTVIADGRLLNVARTKISGFEGQLNYQAEVGRSTVSFNGSANYIDKFEDQLAATSAPVSRVGTIFSPPHWKARAQLGWSRAWVSASVAWNHTGAYNDNRLTDDVLPVGAWNTFDLGVTVHLTGNREKDTRVTFAATNLFNARPPYVAATSALRPANWDPTNASIVGRFVSVELVKKW